MLATAVAAAHIDGSTELHEPLGSGQAQGVGQGGARCRKERVVRRSAKRRLNEAAGRVMGGTALEHEGRALVCEYRQLLAAQTDAAPCLRKKMLPPSSSCHAHGSRRRHTYSRRSSRPGRGPAAR